MNVKLRHLLECGIKYLLLSKGEWYNLYYLKRLKELREDADKGQKEIAEYLGITQQQYSLYETGVRKIPIEQIIALAKYYNVTSDYILELLNKKWWKGISCITPND